MNPLKCAKCGEAILADEYTTYGGLVFHDDDCLAEFTVDRRLDVNTVAANKERKSRV